MADFKQMGSLRAVSVCCLQGPGNELFFQNLLSVLQGISCKQTVKGICPRFNPSLSEKLSGRRFGSSASTMALSMTFSSSLTFPGQLCFSNIDMAAGVIPLMSFSKLILNLSIKCWLKSGMSSGCSLSGGSLIGKTFSL